MDRVTVSVIIPVYNAERHLEECLDSCLEQTLDGIEIICINDGSTDNTEKILKKYADKHSNIDILNQKNQGSGIARNLGMEHAKGEFVAFMDSDDYYPDKDALKKLYDAAIKEGVLVCGGSALRLNEGKVNRVDIQYCFSENRIMYYKEYQDRGGFVQFLYNTQFLKESKITFPSYRRFQDPPFFVEIMTKADRFYAISDCVYMIRETDKVVQYNDKDVIMGVLHGYIDILRISRINQLEKLHMYMVNHTNEILPAYKLIYQGDDEVYQCYEKVMSEFDETLLMQGTTKISKPKCLSKDEIVRIVERSLERERALIDKVNSYEKVFIYGAGKIGRSIYFYLKQRGCNSDMEFMVSAENPDYTACGKPVRSVRECSDARENALVIIAAVHKNNIEQMEENAKFYQFQHIEIIFKDELMLFGADMMQGETLTIY